MYVCMYYKFTLGRDENRGYCTSVLSNHYMVTLFIHMQMILREVLDKTMYFL